MLTPLQVQLLAKINTANMKKDSLIITDEIQKLEWSDLLTISWIWNWTVKLLSDAWVKNIEQLKALWEDEIKKIITNPLTLKSIFNFLNKK